MTKFAGMVGFASGQTEDEGRPGIVEVTYVDHPMRGDLLRASKTEQEGNEKLDTLVLSNRISVMGDKYSYSNFMSIAYVIWMGQKWKVASVEVQKPRLILTLGGVWNG